jgi:hypothetical protein
MNKTGCIVETINDANQAGNPILPAVEIMRGVSTGADSAQTVIACERCDAEFAISTELSNDRAQLILATAPTATTATCTNSKYRQVGDWVTNLNKRWFNVGLLSQEDSKETPEDESEKPYHLSGAGLEIVLHNATQDLAAAKAAKESLLGADSAKQLEKTTASNINILDLLLVRNDGTTWREEIDARSEVELEKSNDSMESS